MTRDEILQYQAEVRALSWARRVRRLAAAHGVQFTQLATQEGCGWSVEGAPEDKRRFFAALDSDRP